jgi:dTDP-glucose 4,6-dehydratase
MIVVTGGAGFIGSELIHQLVARGHNVVAVDNLVNGRRENLEEVASDRVKLVEADIRDSETMARVLGDAEVVFHLACLGVRHSIHSPHENHEVNAGGTLTLLSAARAAGVKRFVHVSSSEIYGPARCVPMSEDHPPLPTTVYGASKLAGEAYARAFFRTYRYPTVIVRPFNAYGPRSHHEGDSGEVIPKFLLRCLGGSPMVVFGDGTQTRDFSYVTDVANGILLAGFEDGAVGETINLGSGSEITINDLAALVAEVVGLGEARIVHDTERPGDVRRLYADTSKARDLLGFKCTVALREGLSRLKAWYLELDRSVEALLAGEVVHNWQAGEAGHGLDERPRIPVARPSLGEAEAAAARRPIRSGWVTQGPEVAALEREFAAYTGARYACAVSSGTAALHLALLAVGVRTADEVITASHSFIATANSIRYCGATPVFVDIEPATFNIDPRLIERAISHRTRAILCVHQVGMPCDMAGILRIAKRHALPVIEDAACAIGSEIEWGGSWERIGRPHGDIACFSFHPRKLVTTGDGGMLTTNSEAFDLQFRLGRQHGMSVSDVQRHAARTVAFESYVTLGYNYRMTDIQAAVGRVQLSRLAAGVERRRWLAARYASLLTELPDIGPPVEPAHARSNWQSYCVRLPAGCDQRQVMQAMLDEGVATRRGVMCAHREPAYPKSSWSCGVPTESCECPAGSCARLRESERAQDQAIVLPLFQEMTADEQDRVIAALARARSVGRE